jgi:uncharacterized protein
MKFKAKKLLVATVLFVNVLAAQSQTITEINRKGKQDHIVHDLLKAFNLGSDSVLALFHADAIIEYPYAYSLGTPSALNKTDYGNYLENALANMPDIEFSKVNVYLTTQKDVSWAEFHGEVTIPTTNQRYKQDYVVYVMLKDGKIFRYKEYWNPAAASAMGNEKEIQTMFNEKTKN